MPRTPVMASEPMADWHALWFCMALERAEVRVDRAKGVRAPPLTASGGMPMKSAVTVASVGIEIGLIGPEFGEVPEQVSTVGPLPTLVGLLPSPARKQIPEPPFEPLAPLL